jgi:hypothetical protein
MTFSVYEAILLSVIVFFPVNLLENLVHYYIGIYSENSENKESSSSFSFSFSFKFPKLKDFMYMAITMIVFALIQGLLTYMVEHRSSINIYI